MTMTDRRRMLAKSSKKGHNLPSGFQEVEWIYNNGETGITTSIFSKKTSLEMAGNFIIEDEAVKADSVHPVFAIKTNTLGVGIKAPNYISQSGNIPVSLHNEHKVTLTKNFETNTVNIYLDNELKLTYSSSWFDNYAVTLAGAVNGGDSMKTIYAEYYNGEVWYRFVPCYRKSDGVIGMYETEFGVFYAANNKYLKGADVN